MFYKLNIKVNIMFSLLNTNCCNFPALVRHSPPFGTLILRSFNLSAFWSLTGSGQVSNAGCRLLTFRFRSSSFRLCSMGQV